jgi:hypothetical protein
MFACRWVPTVAEARLKTGIWIRALIRRCDLAAIPIALLARGDGDAGAILLKFNGGAGGCSVLTQARGLEGQLLWMRATGPLPVAETDADAYIERQRRRDPDIWVAEIESGSAEEVIDGEIV